MSSDKFLNCCAAFLLDNIVSFLHTCIAPSVSSSTAGVFLNFDRYRLVVIVVLQDCSLS